MENVDYIICGDYILTMNQSLDVLTQGAIAVKGTTIIDVGDKRDISVRYRSRNVLDGKNRVVLPGFINTHTHAAMVLFRGLADDLPLKEWLEGHVWPAENHWLSPSFVEEAVSLACLEMLKAGVTTYNDMYFFGDNSAAATKKIGMRAVLGVGILDFPTVSAKNADECLENALRFIEKWKGDELITPAIAPHAVYTCGPATLKRSKEIADKYGVPLHVHLSETEWEVGESLVRYKRRPVEHLESIGFLDKNVLAVHCVWIEDGEIELLAKRGVGVSHCMESNLKLASGFAPVVTMLMRGVKVTFGTDGAASNNDLSVLSEMSTTAKVHKALSNNPTVLDARTVVLMATRWGAEALGLGDSVGSIEKGKTADIITINLGKPHLTPLYDVYSHIVYAAMASDVEDVMVNGRLLMRGRRHEFVSEDEILQRASQWGEKIRMRNSNNSLKPEAVKGS